MTNTIDGTTGIASVDGSAGSPSVRGSDANSGIVYAADTVAVSTGGSERMRVDSSGNVGIGTTATGLSSYSTLHIKGPSGEGAALRLQDNSDTADSSDAVIYKNSTALYIRVMGTDYMINYMNGAEKTRLDSDGTFMVGCTVSRPAEFAHPDGFSVRGDTTGQFQNTVSGAMCGLINRDDSDGTILGFRQDGDDEGSISISGSTVSYNGGHLSRWSQIKGLSSTDKSARPTIYQGTVMSNLDDLCVWSHPDELYTEQDKIDGQIPEGKNVGDVKKAAYTEDNQQLNMTKISDVEGDKDVAGVFWAWDDDDDTIVNDFFVAMTGDMVIRVAASTTVARGDLLISAGDGTAKPQADDIVRSSTIAKVISTNSTATYADGSKAYPCVLMAC